MNGRLRPLAVLGCSSNAGKSLLVTALARWFAREGVDVVPFKAQNMSNNARVVAGGEIGVAQWLQANAARVEPVLAMNPVLLKPEADTRSQVVVDGQARHDLTAMPWRDRGPHLWPHMESAFDLLHNDHQLVLIEGAGSPAEINLPDLVNNRVVEHADAATLLVADIDRGGAFAHLFGTWAFVPESVRTRISGFVLNNFRGDATLLEPGPTMLREQTGMALAGVLPHLPHQLPDEEGGTVRAVPPSVSMTVAIIRYPYASNLDEFHLLANVAHVRWAMEPTDLDGADVVVLPGSKHVAHDAEWVRTRRLDEALAERASRGDKIVGICGGAMLLGGAIDDPGHVEESGRGMDLLPLRTVMAVEKRTTATQVIFPSMPPPWSALSDHAVDGYEIRSGRVLGEECEMAPTLWCDGSVLASTVHGLFEDRGLLAALFGIAPPDVLEETFEMLADAVEEHLDTVLLRSMVGLN